MDLRDIWTVVVGPEAITPKSQRYLNIANEIKSKVVIRQHVVSHGLFGEALAYDRRILAPIGKTVEELYVVAHECAHVYLGHGTIQCNHLNHYYFEIEADQWAKNYLLMYHQLVIPYDQDEANQTYFTIRFYESLTSCNTDEMYATRTKYRRYQQTYETLRSREDYKYPLPTEYITHLKEKSTP